MKDRNLAIGCAGFLAIVLVIWAIIAIWWLIEFN